MQFASNASNNTSANGSADHNISAVTTAVGTGGQQKGGAQTSGPENNPSYTTVYIGNLPHEVTQTELHRQFLALGVGVIEDVRVQRDKGFGFVRYRSHEEAALAIQLANGRVICGKSIKCSWGSKPTPPGASSNALPPPSAPFQGVVAPQGLNQGYTAADILAYRQLNMSQAGAGQPLLPLSAQQGMGLGLGHGPMGVVGPNQNVYDNFQAGAGLPAAAAAAAAAMRQQIMYYQ